MLGFFLDNRQHLKYNKYSVVVNAFFMFWTMRSSNMFVCCKFYIVVSSIWLRILFHKTWKVTVYHPKLFILYILILRFCQWWSNWLTNPGMQPGLLKGRDKTKKENCYLSVRSLGDLMEGIFRRGSLKTLQIFICSQKEPKFCSLIPVSHSLLLPSCTKSKHCTGQL